jgi:hypothetical protein
MKKPEIRKANSERIPMSARLRTHLGGFGLGAPAFTHSPRAIVP